MKGSYGALVKISRTANDDPKVTAWNARERRPDAMNEFLRHGFIPRLPETPPDWL